MSDNLRNHLPLLKSVAQNRNHRSRQTHLKHAANDLQFHKCMKEICRNVVKRKVPFSLNDVKKLRKFKTAIKELASNRTSRVKRKKHIVQAGAGFLPILIPIISSLLAGFLGK